VEPQLLPAARITACVRRRGARLRPGPPGCPRERHPLGGLWLVLAVGVVVLGGVALALLRQVNAPRD
ncbi:hypothetical protein, partial [Ramlibacter sp.]|uniref:hypothetical protein n=1 Tax=Ramlibacter sp. TaxID=1917967 RepID=UPI0026172E31